MGMKATADSNEIVFSLRVAPSTRTAGDLKSFGDQVIKEQKRIHDSTSSMRGKGGLANFGIPDEKELAKAATAQLRHQQRMADAQKRALDKETAEVKKAADLKIKESKRAADEQIRDAQRVAAAEEREADRIHHRHRQRQLERATRNRASRLDAEGSRSLSGEGKPVNMGGDGIESLPLSQRAAIGGFGRRAAGLTSVLHGGAEVARGVAYSGLVGEENSQKMLQTMFKIESGVSLLRGGTHIATGLGGLAGGGAAIGAVAAPVGAFVAAVAGAALAINAIREQITGEANNPNSQSGRIGAGWAKLGGLDYRAGRWLMGKFGKEYSGGERGLVESEDRLASQQKHVTKSQADRQRRMADDTDFATKAFADNDRSSMRGARMMRTDAEKLYAIDKQLGLERGTRRDLLEREGQAKPGVELDNVTRLREESEGRILHWHEQQREVLIKTGREALELSRNRAESEAEIARQGYERQAGLAKDLAGQFKSDMSKYGSLSPSERMQTDAAAMAFRSGRATPEQEQRLRGFNEFRDDVEARSAQRGMATGGLAFAPDLASGAREASAEAAKRFKEYSDAQLKVQSEHKLLIQFEEGHGFNQDMALQIEEFVKKAIAEKDRDYKKMLDDLKSDLRGERRAREIHARR